MIHCSTFGISSTRSQTRIYTLFSNTCFIIRAVLIDGTFWCTIRRGTNVTYVAATLWITVIISTCCIWSTWIRQAWVNNLWYVLFFSSTSYKWISFISRYTGTVWTVMVNTTFGVFATCSYTGIDAFLSNACLIERTLGAS